MRGEGRAEEMVETAGRADGVGDNDAAGFGFDHELGFDLDLDEQPSLKLNSE